MAFDRIFINHPKVGTVIVRKSRPHIRSRRHKLMDSFMWGVAQAEWPKRIEHYCKVCDKMLFNPQSILMHIGNGCEKSKIHTP